MNLNQLVFLDEFGANTLMVRMHALAHLSQRAVCHVPHGNWKTNAMTTHGMIAAASFDGAIDTEIFLAFVRNELVPQLLRGQIMVMNNHPAHRSPKIDELINGVGCSVLRLPPYSPDFDPIEMAISKMKQLLRSQSQRSVEGLFNVIAQALRQVRPDEAILYITHCGYCDTGG